MKLVCCTVHGYGGSRDGDEPTTHDPHHVSDELPSPLCGMLVDIDHGRLVGVRGDKENPDSQGFLCVRGQASQEIIDNPQRLLYPLIRHRRTDDAWRQASWDEALDLITTRMQAAGREAVGIWAGHGVFSTNGQASFEAMVEVVSQ